MEAQAKQEAFNMITELADFYQILIRPDETLTVDDYMEALLDEWGMNWQKVLKLGIRHMQTRTQQAGLKRSADAGSTGENKKPRGGREELVMGPRHEVV